MVGIDESCIVGVDEGAVVLFVTLLVLLVASVAEEVIDLSICGIYCFQKYNRKIQ